MLKKIFLTTAAVAMLGAGAIALDAKPAEAGVSVQLVHGKWSGHRWDGKRKGRHWRGKRFHGPRFGYYGPHRFCFTKYRTRHVRYWSPRKHRWVSRKVTRPIRICR